MIGSAFHGSWMLLLKGMVGGAGALMALSGMTMDWLGVDITYGGQLAASGLGAVAGAVLGVFAYKERGLG